MEATSELDIFSEAARINGTASLNIKGDGVLSMGSDGLVHVSGTTVHIDDYVEMANGSSVAPESAFPAEPSKDATPIEAPEPVTKSTAINPEDPVSVGGGGLTAGDDNNGGPR